MDSKFSDVEPFGVDDGELDGLTPQQCFALGVEWQMVRRQADSPEPFERPVHSANRVRLAAVLDARGREYRMEFMADDRSESWLWLSVAPEEDGTPNYD